MFHPSRSVGATDMLLHTTPFLIWYVTNLSLTNIGQLTVDLSNLFCPLASVMVLHLQDVLEWPVEIIGDVSYLLMQLLEGVAYHPPGLPKSTSKLWLHSGHVVDTLAVPFSLIRL